MSKNDDLAFENGDFPFKKKCSITIMDPASSKLLVAAPG